MNLPYPALPCRATGCSVPTGLLPCGIYSGPVCRKSEHAIQQIPSPSKSLRILAWIYMTLGECERSKSRTSGSKWIAEDFGTGRRGRG
jgi:hypothetical protein